jgi:hypothetical protein
MLSSVGCGLNSPTPEIVELGMAIGQYIGFGRFLMVLDVERPVCSLE